MLKIYPLIFATALFLFTSCEKEKEYRLSGTLYVDCDQTIPLANCESSVEVAYLERFRLIRESFPFKTDANGEFEVVYKCKSEAFKDDRSNTVDLYFLLDNVPHEFDHDLGKLTVRRDFDLFVNLKFEKTLKSTDTLFLYTNKLDSFMILTSPFNDTTVGPISWNGGGIPKFQDNEIMFPTTVLGFLNNKYTGTKFSGFELLNNCVPNHTIDMVIKD